MSKRKISHEERVKKIRAQMRRSNKITEVFGLTVLTIGTGLLLYVLYHVPTEPRVWIALMVCGIGYWFSFSSWDEVWHPERFDDDEESPPAGAAA